MTHHDWNTPKAHTQRPHHKRMHSARKGKGHDAKHRAAKRLTGDRRAICSFCHRRCADPSRHKRTNH